MIEETQNLKHPNILMIDDTIEILSILIEYFNRKGYAVQVAVDGYEAFELIEKNKPDLILLDINMPGMDGFEVCEKLKQDVRYKNIPVIFISALEDTFDKVKAFAVGGVDYITKPFQVQEVSARVETHLHLRDLQINLENRVEEQVKEIRDAQMSTIFALARLAEARDKTTGKHMERVRQFCQILALAMKESLKYQTQIDQTFIDLIFEASPLHDIGKVSIPDKILLKPGKLDQEEYEIIQKHSALGAATLRQVKDQYPNNQFLCMAIRIAQSHHERWDGQGYPDGLSGETIPIEARIMAVADVYDACRSERPYKKSLSQAECVRIIKEGRGTQFDPEIVDCFLHSADHLNEVHRALHS